jgi:hypothetical protein
MKQRAVVISVFCQKYVIAFRHPFTKGISFPYGSFIVTVHEVQDVCFYHRTARRRANLADHIATESPLFVQLLVPH